MLVMMFETASVGGCHVKASGLQPDKLKRRLGLLDFVQAVVALVRFATTHVI